MSAIETQIDSNSIKRILVIQFRPFGDVLLATSYLKALSDRFPDASIDFLVKKPFHEVLYKNPWISTIVAFDQHSGLRYLSDRLKLFSDIRNRQYDLIIDQQGGTGSGQVVFFSKARYRLGWVGSKWSWCYNLRAQKGKVRYRAAQNFDMLKPLGIPEEPYRFFFHIKPESMAYVRSWLENHQLVPERTIIISPGSPRIKKKWCAENFSMLADQLLLNTDMKVMLLSGPSELADAEAVLKGSSQTYPLALSPDINHAAAFLKHCRLLICNDGGLNHLSVALNVSSLAIFGNTPPIKWSPQGFSAYHYHLVCTEPKNTSDNDFGITPQEVFQKASEILAELPSSNTASSF